MLPSRLFLCRIVDGDFASRYLHADWKWWGTLSEFICIFYATMTCIRLQRQCVCVCSYIYVYIYMRLHVQTILTTQRKGQIQMRNTAANHAISPSFSLSLRFAQASCCHIFAICATTKSWLVRQKNDLMKNTKIIKNTRKRLQRFFEIWNQRKQSCRYLKRFSIKSIEIFWIYWILWVIY